MRACASDLEDMDDFDDDEDDEDSLSGHRPRQNTDSRYSSVVTVVEFHTASDEIQYSFTP